MLARDGITLIKFWFSVSRAEQLRRFVNRQLDPVKRWKLSPIDLASLDKWDEYTEAKESMFFFTDLADAPWTVVKSNDKRRARLEAMRHVLRQVAYDGRGRRPGRHARPADRGPGTAAVRERASGARTEPASRLPADVDRDARAVQGQDAAELIAAPRARLGSERRPPHDEAAGPARRAGPARPTSPRQAGQVAGQARGRQARNPGSARPVPPASPVLRPCPPGSSTATPSCPESGGVAHQAAERAAATPAGASRRARQQDDQAVEPGRRSGSATDPGRRDQPGRSAWRRPARRRRARQRALEPAARPPDCRRPSARPARAARPAG